MNINIFLPFLATKSVCVSLLITSLALACASSKTESDIDYKIGGTAKELRHAAGTISESDLQLHIAEVLGMPQNSVIKLFGKPLAQTVNNKGENALKYKLVSSSSSTVSHTPVFFGHGYRPQNDAAQITIVTKRGKVAKLTIVLPKRSFGQKLKTTDIFADGLFNLRNNYHIANFIMFDALPEDFDHIRGRSIEQRWNIIKNGLPRLRDMNPAQVMLYFGLGTMTETKSPLELYRNDSSFDYLISNEAMYAQFITFKFQNRELRQIEFFDHPQFLILWCSHEGLWQKLLRQFKW
ncbi:MAG: hypothetical protein IPP97_06520 [Candidatus Obscuribacter sp.]|jgi:hypothetical protein|nr:hypothetical protein [Candidatus Obscuribacter sp.]MBP6347902.1 hypothetical protein [Candidatus Obscuribacter sp.]MBP6593731.1 hypothetical protein [Candidatus Obscuribacter sp.]MBP7576251.1 hypothetical protein [Candidatus Obscuribacter sp.]MDQ5966658.1 hypothetical protein [Cyanobacteriota bacterium erpe_2018_sw_39hr_WHONDRS-SW48-000098_B_bin.30]